MIVTLTFDEDGKLLTGADVLSAVAMVEGLGADAVGFNCGLGPKQMRRLLPQLLEACSMPACRCSVTVKLFLTSGRKNLPG